MSDQGPIVFVPSVILGPFLKESINALFGKSREAIVLQALSSGQSLSLSAIARLCSASERSVRNDGQAGWVRAILERYRDAGLVMERDWGNRITYQLVESAPAIALMREVERQTSVCLTRAAKEVETPGQRRR